MTLKQRPADLPGMTEPHASSAALQSRKIGRRSFVGGAMGFSVALLGTGRAQAQLLSDVELLMFDDPGCPWCRKWRSEVGAAYGKSPEGRRAPLHTIMLRGPMPEGLKLASAVRATPTFVLVQGGREVGRITGYGGPDFFWSMLGDLMKKLKAPVAADRA